MSQQLMHVEYHPSDVCLTAGAFRAIAEWLDAKIAADEGLNESERAAARRENVLAMLVAGDDPPTAVERAAAQRFAYAVARAAATEPAGSEMAEAARSVAHGVMDLAERHDPLLLQIV